jgi:hypothetical protein
MVKSSPLWLLVSYVLGTLFGGAITIAYLLWIEEPEPTGRASPSRAFQCERKA